MDAPATPPSLPGLQRIVTRIPGLDTLLGGGLLAGDSYLVTGKPGTGKTTLANHLAFSQAAAGKSVVFATIMTETHDRMLAHLQGFQFADPSLVGTHIRYVSLQRHLQEGGLELVLQALRDAVREHNADLLIVDGTGIAETFAHSEFEFGRFVHAIQARSALLGCTTLLLYGRGSDDAIEAHVDGVIQLSHEPVLARDVRWIRVAKLRGSRQLTGRHQFAITQSGIAVFPRLEAALMDSMPTWPEINGRRGFGVPGLDAMLKGGVVAGGSTVVMGPPGAGKTILGLHFLAEGVQKGERGIIATFQETGPALAATGDRIGLEIGKHIESGQIQVLWRAPMEMSPDAWGWALLSMIEEHRPRRLVIDTYTDLVRLFAIPERQTSFAAALTNELRARGVSTLYVLELSTLVSPSLHTPVPNISAAMDAGILLRTVELRSTLLRMVSILKDRHDGFDPTIREFTIGDDGITVGEAFDATGLLTGTAVPIVEAST
jgi:circadian clock protein KaiC